MCNMFHSAIAKRQKDAQAGATTVFMLLFKTKGSTESPKLSNDDDADSSLSEQVLFSELMLEVHPT